VRDVLGKVVPETLHGLRWNLLATVSAARHRRGVIV
jgi:hypothetical protein